MYNTCIGIGKYLPTYFDSKLAIILVNFITTLFQTFEQPGIKTKVRCVGAQHGEFKSRMHSSNAFKGFMGNFICYSLVRK